VGGLRSLPGWIGSWLLQGWILARVDLAWMDRGGCPSGLAAPVDQEKGATRVNSGHCGLVTKSNMCNCPARWRSSCRRPSAHLMVFVEERFDRVLGLVRMVHGRADQSDVISVNDVAQRCACERVSGSGVGSSGNDATARKGYEQCVRSWSDDKNFALPGLRSAVFYFPCRQESTWAGEGYHPPW
jgi:hypothetical protein